MGVGARRAVHGHPITGFIDLLLLLFMLFMLFMLLVESRLPAPNRAIA